MIKVKTTTALTLWNKKQKKILRKKNLNLLEFWRTKMTEKKTNIDLSCQNSLKKLIFAVVVEQLPKDLSLKWVLLYFFLYFLKFVLKFFFFFEKN